MREGVRAGGPQEEGYFASVSDLMVGLLFLFIILLMAFALSFRQAEQAADTLQQRLAGELGEVREERDRLQDERSALEAERRRLALERDELVRERQLLTELLARLAGREALRTDLLWRIADALLARGVEVEVEPEKGILRLPEKLLFDSGRAELRPEGQRALAVLAEVLAEILPCYAGEPPSRHPCPAASEPILETVLVEGHTDDVPIHAGPFRDNWELSAARGVNTFKALIAYAPALERMRNLKGEALLGISAYEARRPVVAGTSEEARRRNRRIDLRFLIAAPSAADVNRIRQRLEELAPLQP